MVEGEGLTDKELLEDYGVLVDFKHNSPIIWKDVSNVVNNEREVILLSELEEHVRLLRMKQWLPGGPPKPPIPSWLCSVLVIAKEEDLGVSDEESIRLAEEGFVL